MKKIIEVIIFLILCMNCHAQMPENGLYNSEYGFICINNDTIIMDLSSHGFYYLGTYSVNDNKLFLGENSLIGRNAMIVKERCSPDSIEIKLICKYRFVFNDGDENTRQSMSCVFYSKNTDCIDSKDDGCIYIGRDESDSSFIIDEFCITDYDEFVFSDCYQLPLEYGVRYVFYQKNLAQAMFLHNDSITMSYMTKRDGKKTIEFNIPCYGYKFFKYSGECDSCLEEFKKQFPGLIE